MTPASDHLPPHPRLELARLVLGGLLVLVLQAYGAGAAAAVLLSDAETPGDKAGAAVAAVPTLVEEWRQARYVVEHRDEIRDAVDYLQSATPPQEELQRTLDESSETLRAVETTYDEVLDAIDAVDDLTPRPDLALGDLRDAYAAKPDLSSIGELAGTAEQLGPVADRVDVLVPVYYSGVLAVNDNFASDELAATLTVAAASLAIAFLLAQAVGFWVRRGRPGLLARALHRLGARVFRGWYVRHAAYALGDPVYDAARQRAVRDLLDDASLSAQTRRELAAHLEGRAG